MESPTNTDAPLTGAKADGYHTQRVCAFVCKFDSLHINLVYTKFNPAMCTKFT